MNWFVGLLGWMLAVVVWVNAQTAVLTATGGDVQYLDAGIWKKALTGTRLTARHQVKLSTASYAALIINGSKSVELRQPGTYKVSDFSAGANPKDPGIASKYMDFVLKHATASSRDNRSTAAVERTGAVERGTFKPVSPLNSKIADENLTFIWFKQGNINDYKLEILDEHENLVHTTEVADTFVTLNISKLNLKSGASYTWRVATKGNLLSLTSDASHLTILSEAEKKKLEDNANQLISLTGGVGSALSQAALAIYYQEAGVNYRAMNAYLEAIRLAPEADTYRDMFNSFLEKQGLGNSQMKNK